MEMRLPYAVRKYGRISQSLLYYQVFFRKRVYIKICLCQVFYAVKLHSVFALSFIISRVFIRMLSHFRRLSKDRELSRESFFIYSSIPF